MKLRYLFFPACTLLFSFPVFAAPVASSSDASLEEMDVEYLQELLVDYEGMDDSEVLQQILAQVTYISDNLTGPGMASASDADRDDDLPLAIEEDLEYSSEGVEGSIEPYAPEEFAAGLFLEDIDLLDSAALYAATEDQYVNVIRYDVTFRGDDYILLIPPEYMDSLYIDADGYLWNMSTNTITGRAVDSDFDPLQEEGYLFYLTPCLGNNFSTLREYGSPNYVRHYYWSTSYGNERLTYDTTYGTITVNSWSYPFYSSQTLLYILIFLIAGGVLLLWLRNYKNY